MAHKRSGAQIKEENVVFGLVSCVVLYYLCFCLTRVLKTGWVNELLGESSLSAGYSESYHANLLVTLFSNLITKQLKRHKNMYPHKEHLKPLLCFGSHNIIFQPIKSLYIAPITMVLMYGFHYHALSGAT